MLAPPLASQKMKSEDALAVIDRYFGPKELPHELITVNGNLITRNFGPLQTLSRSSWDLFFLFNRSDKTGAYWYQFRAIPDKPRHWYQNTVPVRFERLPDEPYFLWADVMLIKQENVHGDHASSLLLLDGTGTGLYQIPLPTQRDQNLAEQREILPALFTLCTNLQRLPSNEGIRTGRIYFYRGDEMTGSGLGLDVLLNGSSVGRLSGPSCSFYVDEPPGEYIASCNVLPSLERLTSFKHEARLNIKPGETKYVRIRIHFGLIHPKVGMSVEDADSALRAIGK